MHLGKCGRNNGYAVVFDRNLRDGDRITRLPAMYFHKASVFEKENSVKTITFRLLMT